MASTFSPIPAKPTFGTAKPVLYASDRLLQLKGKTLYASFRNDNNSVSYENMYLFYPRFHASTLFNRSNLLYNLYSKENLTDAITVGIDNTDIKASSISPALIPFYKYYYIDPKGELFGKSPCGVNNYVHYMEPDCVFTKLR